MNDDRTSQSNISFVHRAEMILQMLLRINSVTQHQRIADVYRQDDKTYLKETEVLCEDGSPT